MVSTAVFCNCRSVTPVPPTAKVVAASLFAGVRVGRRARDMRIGDVLAGCHVAGEQDRESDRHLALRVEVPAVDEADQLPLREGASVGQSREVHAGVDIDVRTELDVTGYRGGAVVAEHERHVPPRARAGGRRILRGDGQIRHLHVCDGDDRGGRLGDVVLRGGRVGGCSGR